MWVVSRDVLYVLYGTVSDQERQTGTKWETDPGTDGWRDLGGFWVDVESQWSTFTAESKLFIGLSPACNCQLITTQRLNISLVFFCMCVCVFRICVLECILFIAVSEVSHSYAAYLLVSPFILFFQQTYMNSQCTLCSLLNLVTSMSLYLWRQACLKVTGAAWKEALFSIAIRCSPLPSTLSTLTSSSWRRDLIVRKVYSIIMEHMCVSVLPHC